MKSLLRQTTVLLWTLLLIPLFTACNDEDDVEEIFMNKVWKMSRLTAEGNTGQFPAGFWSDQASYNNSMTAFSREDTYTIEFKAGSGGSTSGGTFTAQAVKATLTGDWTVDGKNGLLTLNVKKQSTTESDILAKKFIEGLKKISRYEGSSKQITLFFEEGQATWLIGFTPKP
ncbi:MAG: DUF4847 family protein [Bacteroides sp.]|nr:DUF4847 family protein [Bacteroides sp.]